MMMMMAAWYTVYRMVRCRYVLCPPADQSRSRDDDVRCSEGLYIHRQCQGGAPSSAALSLARLYHSSQTGRGTGLG
ncbi:hypothetical protein BaRGS_00005959 [Batillaria attramentaria]|uniref:Secreted protein n=1 Tax=Batillaria attramentaria TaxID=370345 RepID=A0ABD0LT26_9CAEN